MEEIDNIIIDSLRNLGCDIGDEIQNLKQFDADLVVSAISHSLHAIDPTVKLQTKLPPVMSLKLKVATALSEQIRDIGFRGDLGYQTILYCNEVEIRRLLMFLIERLPRDAHKEVQSGETGYVPKLVKLIEGNVRKSMEQMWLPAGVLQRGTRPVENGYIVNSFGDSRPVKTSELFVNSQSENIHENEAVKDYWIHVVPEITKQCSSASFLPSLLYKSNHFSKDDFQDVLSSSGSSEFALRNDMAEEESGSIINLTRTRIEQGTGTITNGTENETKAPAPEPEQTPLKNLLLELEASQRRFIELQGEMKNRQSQLQQMKLVIEDSKKSYENCVYQATVKKKTLTVAKNEENKAKLHALIENGNERLLILANQWNEVQTPLLEEYKSLQSNLSSEEIKSRQNRERLEAMKKLHHDLLVDLQDKKDLEQKLIKRCEEINRTNNRSAYTQRIMEIIGNIKKQDIEIQKVLKDTRNVQKEINSLTGKVDRSFTLSDELIFREAKNDETARKAYKLLAALRSECAEIIKAATEIGSIERESRNLQDQIDIENAKETVKKLERVMCDLEQIRLETASLMAQRKT